MKRALVTGACGFVGRHTCKRLAGLGYDIIAVDNLAAQGSKHPHEWPDHLKCPVSFVNDSAQNVFRNSKDHFDLVVHLAAVVGGRVMIEQQPLAVAEDLSIDAEMFNWASKTKPGHIMYLSSSAAYPIYMQRENAHYKLVESVIRFGADKIGQPDMSYGWAKLTGEYLAQLAHKNYGLSVTCYRPFSGYGEDQDDTYPFPAILSRAMAREDPLTVWSDTVRDFIYIEDCIDGMLYFKDKIKDGGAINLGTGRGTSFSTLAMKMAAAVGYIPDIKILNDKPKGVFYRVADVHKASLFEFIPKTPIDAGITRCIKLVGSCK